MEAIQRYIWNNFVSKTFKIEDDKTENTIWAKHHLGYQLIQNIAKNCNDLISITLKYQKGFLKSSILVG